MREPMPVRYSFGLAAVVLASMTLAAHAEPASGPLEPLLTSKTDSLCYRRDYDAAHLRNHPGQMTKSIVLSFRQDAVRIELQQTDRKAPRYIVATCEWRVGAGRDIQGKTLIPAFTKGSGYDCIVMTSPSSAEEGGYTIIDAGPDAKSLTLFVDDPVTVQDSLDKDHDIKSFKLGREDRIFKLARTDRATCKPMEDALQGP